MVSHIPIDEVIMVARLVSAIQAIEYTNMIHWHCIKHYRVPSMMDKILEWMKMPVSCLIYLYWRVSYHLFHPMLGDWSTPMMKREQHTHSPLICQSSLFGLFMLCCSESYCLFALSWMNEEERKGKRTSKTVRWNHVLRQIASDLPVKCDLRVYY